MITESGDTSIPRTAVSTDSDMSVLLELLRMSADEGEKLNCSQILRRVPDTGASRVVALGIDCRSSAK
jgi:hypothetical protein